MVREAEANAGADKKRRAFIEAKNHADAMIDQVENTLTQHGAALTAAERSEAEAAVTATRAALASGDHDRLTQATERMSQAAIKIEEAAHRAASQGDAGRSSGPPHAAAGGTSDDKVVDAQFEEVH